MKSDKKKVDIKGKQILVDVDDETTAERKSNDEESHVPVVSNGMFDQEKLDGMYALIFCLFFCHFLSFRHSAFFIR